MTATSLTAQDLIRAFFERFGSGDRDGVLALFAEDAELDIPGAASVPWTGRRTGRAGVAAFLDASAAVEPQEFAVEQVMGEGGTGVALGRFSHRVRSTGKVFTSHFALHVTVRDGLIAGYRMFEDSYAIAEAFRG